MKHPQYDEREGYIYDLGYGDGAAAHVLSEFTYDDVTLLGQWLWDLLERRDRGPEGIEPHIQPTIDALEDLMFRIEKELPDEG